MGKKACQAGNPLFSISLDAAALSDYGYGNMYPQYPVMDKRDGRPSLADYLRLAAMQYELDKEEEASAQTQGILHSCIMVLLTNLQYLKLRKERAAMFMKV